MVITPLVRTARRPLRVLAVGDRGGVGQVASSWSQCRDVDLVAAVVDDRDDDADLDLETFGLPQGRGLDAVEELTLLHRPDTVVVLPGTALGPDDLRRLCWSLEGTRTSLAVLTGFDSVPLRRLSLAHVAGHSLTEIGSSRPAAHVRLGKALVDRVGGSLLLVLASPLLLALVIAIRLDTRGAAFFRQVRVGQDGRLFTMFKLRTMVVDAEARKAELAASTRGTGSSSRSTRDPRITRVGRFLRRSSLDELPQLVNVVRGEMSLVGPRPALPREVEQYDVVARRRLAVKPGMTGLWQVSGRSDLDWDTSVELDVHYTDNVTIGDDFRICLQTVRAVHRWEGGLLMSGPVLLVSSQGGHLAQLLVLRSWWEGHDRVWVCPDTPDVRDRLADEHVVTSYSPTTRNVVNLARNAALAVRVLRRHRPSLVVSTGAGVAVPFFVAARAMRIPTAFIEVYDRVDSPTMTGRLCGPFTTRRIVQWDQQLDFYPDAHLVGPLL